MPSETSSPAPSDLAWLRRTGLFCVRALRHQRWKWTWTWLCIEIEKAFPETMFFLLMVCEIGSLVNTCLATAIRLLAPLEAWPRRKLCPALRNLHVLAHSA